MTDRGHGSGAAVVAEDSRARTLGTDGDTGARLWLPVLQTLADRAAHEIRGALNAVAVNVEVVRARASGRTPAELTPFVEHAAEQVERLTERTEALIAMVRPAARPLDVGTMLVRLVTLLGPAARSTGGAVEIADESDGAVTVTGADPDVARLALAAVLLAESDGRRHLLCRIAVRDAIIVRVEGADRAATIAPDVIRAAADAGIGIELAPDATIVAFPAAAR